MTNLKQRIEAIEAKAADSALLGSLSSDPEARIYNRRLTEELKQYARKLRLQQQIGPQSDDAKASQS